MTRLYITVVSIADSEEALYVSLVPSRLEDVLKFYFRTIITRRHCSSQK